MKQFIGLNHVAAWFATLLFVATGAAAQQNAAVPVASQLNSTYSANREVSLQGAVMSFTASSSAPPLGAHVVLQTPSGAIDVHLGNPKLLDTSGMSLAAGDQIRVVGENVTVAGGTQFLARLLQKNGQTVALRSTRGLPLRPMAKRGRIQEGVL